MPYLSASPPTKTPPSRPPHNGPLRIRHRNSVPDHLGTTEGHRSMTDTADFGTFGRFTETPVDGMSPQMKDAYQYTRELRDLVPGPHKIWLANPTLFKTIVPTGAYY